ncbi:MAG: class I SAM-dependent methyltransferase [Actinomycetota bacterium]|nr:class I SAM-dependent methyltransferase [Actinomycetota bacterium]
MSEEPVRTWSAIWSSRAPASVPPASLLALIRADGFDTPFSFPDADAWTQYVRTFSERLSLPPGSRVYEVGCGAGAFLLPLQQTGMGVGGCDLSPALIDLARRALNSQDLSVCEGACAPVRPQYDAVIAHGVFQYFPDLSYARTVLARMVEKASRAVALLDLPDAEREAEEVEARIRAFGGIDTYRERYEGLDVLSFDRDWLAKVFSDLGMSRVTFTDDTLPGRPAPSTRFNTIATR